MHIPSSQFILILAPLSKRKRKEIDEDLSHGKKRINDEIIYIRYMQLEKYALEKYQTEMLAVWTERQRSPRRKDRGLIFSSTGQVDELG